MVNEVIWGSDQDIVHVDRDLSGVLVLEGSKNPCHSAYERGWGIAKPEVHDHWLILA
jgi:hypothetical protein